MHCVRRRLHSLLKLSKRLSPEQIGSMCKCRLYLDLLLLYTGKKPIQQLVQADEKAPLNIGRFSSHAGFWWSAYILECPSRATPRVGEREKFLLEHRCMWCSKHRTRTKQQGYRGTLWSVSLSLLPGGWGVMSRSSIWQNLPKPQDHRFLFVFSVNLLQYTDDLSSFS